MILILSPGKSNGRTRKRSLMAILWGLVEKQAPTYKWSEEDDAMATLTIQTIDHTGVAESLVAAAAAGDQFANDGRIFIHVLNTNGASRDVTINSQSNCNQGFDHNIVVTVPATTGDMMIGPFPPSRFDDGGGFVQVTYEAETGVTIAAIRLISNP